MVDGLLVVWAVVCLPAVWVVLGLPVVWAVLGLPVVVPPVVGAGLLVGLVGFGLKQEPRVNDTPSRDQDHVPFASGDVGVLRDIFNPLS